MDGIAFDAFRVQLADGAFGGVGGVGRAHYFTQLLDRVFAFESHHNDRAFGHEGNEAGIEGPLAMYGIEAFGLRLWLSSCHAQAADRKAMFFQKGQYGLPALTGGYSVRLDD